MVNYPYDSQTTTGRPYFSSCKTATDYVDDLSDGDYLTVTNTGCAEDHLVCAESEPLMTGDLPYLTDKGRAEKDEPVEEPP